MTAHTITVPKSAHYYTEGEITEKTRYAWFVAHGYGQLASNLIRKWTSLVGSSDEHFVIAPEGLSRFYWGDMLKQQVAASWMTKGDRLDEIHDFCIYLTLLYNEMRSQLPPETKIIFLGFSQGCATLLRWIHQEKPHFDHLALWGGGVPQDLAYLPLKDYFLDKKIHMICGNNDEFINEEVINTHRTFVQQQGFTFHSETIFEGRHEILTPVLHDFFEKEIK